MVVTVVAVLGTKHVIARPDTGGHLGGGSFPSGHMTIAVVTVGGVLLLALPRTRWWQWVAVSPVWLGMAGCLLYGDIHWVTDVLGGALLAWALLGVAAVIPDRTGVSATQSSGRNRRYCSSRDSASSRMTASWRVRPPRTRSSDTCRSSSSGSKSPIDWWYPESPNRSSRTACLAA